MEIRTLVREEVEGAVKVQTQLNLTMERILSDHEARIRFIERVVNYGLGFLALAKLAMDHLPAIVK